MLRFGLIWTTCIDVTGSYLKDRGFIGNTCAISGLLWLVGDDLAFCLPKYVNLHVVTSDMSRNNRIQGPRCWNEYGIPPVLQEVISWKKKHQQQSQIYFYFARKQNNKRIEVFQLRPKLVSKDKRLKHRMFH